MFPHGRRAGSYRPTVMAPRGMVTTPHYLASAAGLHVLRQGGNAVEAALAAAAAVAVVYPHMNGLGGDNFWLIYDAGSGQLRALNASGYAGSLAAIERYRELGHAHIPTRGLLAAITVPGAVAGWGAAFAFSRQAMGGRLDWATLLADAREYATGGFPASTRLARWVEAHLDDRQELGGLEGSRRIFGKANGDGYRPGERFCQPELARTLQVVAEEGPEVFYRGALAREMAAFFEKEGGLLTAEDFADFHPEWVEPLRVRYRGYEACNQPPNSQGMASLAILNILDHLDLRALEPGGPDHIHAVVEATKLAFADRDRWLTDPRFATIPTDRLLARAYGEEQARRITISRAARGARPGPAAGDTIWLGVVDEAGNAVSLIQSLYYEFGSGVVAGRTGVLFQNRGVFFSLDPAHVNSLQPRKRTFHTLNAPMLLQDGRPFLIYGCMGGEGQPQYQAALVTRLVDFGFELQEAIEAPRWLWGRTWGPEASSLYVESRVGRDVIEALGRRGHTVQAVGEWSEMMGHAQAILVDPETGARLGGADPRADGVALGY